MTNKTIIYCLAALLLVTGIASGVGIAMGKSQSGNDVFTDEFFKDMESISVFLNMEAVLEGEDAEEMASYLKSLRLEPTETPDTPATSEVRYGGNLGYCINYQDGSFVRFTAEDALLTFPGAVSKSYFVVDKAGEQVTDFGETIWNFFQNEA